MRGGAHVPVTLDQAEAFVEDLGTAVPLTFGGERVGEARLIQIVFNDTDDGPTAHLVIDVHFEDGAGLKSW